MAVACVVAFVTLLIFCLPQLQNIKFVLIFDLVGAAAVISAAVLVYLEY